MLRIRNVCCDISFKKQNVVTTSCSSETTTTFSLCLAHCAIIELNRMLWKNGRMWHHPRHSSRAMTKHEKKSPICALHAL